MWAGGPPSCAILSRMPTVLCGETSEGPSCPGGRSPAGTEARPPAPERGGKAWRPAVGWLTGVAVLAAIAINLAGIGAIAVAQRGVVEEAQRLLRLETEARAGALESVLASTRADLAFLTGSPTFFGLESALVSRDPREARWRRLEAEGALLLFLRGHPETAHLAARSDPGAVLVSAGRRGGIPVLWNPGDTERAAQAEGALESEGGPAPVAGKAITGRFEFATGVRRVSGAVKLEATIDGGHLLAHNGAVENPARACALLDRTGALLAAEPDAADAVARAGAAVLYAEAPVRTESWSAPSPWRLVCTQRRGQTEALVAPLSARYRMTLILNLAAMSLALLLGMFAVKEGRRRQSLEAAARGEARGRD